MNVDAGKGRAAPRDGDGTDGRAANDEPQRLPPAAGVPARREAVTSGLPPEQVLAYLQRVFENVWNEPEFHQRLTQYVLRVIGGSMVGLYALTPAGEAGQETATEEESESDQAGSATATPKPTPPPTPSPQLLALTLAGGGIGERLAKHETLDSIIRRAMASGAAFRATLPFPEGNQFLFAAPFNSAGGSRICMVAALPPERQLYSEPSFAIVQLATQFFVQRELFIDSSEQRTSFRQATTLVDSFGNSNVNGRTLRHSCHLLAGDLQKFIGCDHVAIATGGARCKVQALSSMADWDKRSTGVTELRRAMQEAVARDEILVWPPQESIDPDFGCPAPQDALLREYDASLVVIGPLRTALATSEVRAEGKSYHHGEGEPSGPAVGAWVYLWSRRDSENCEFGSRELRIIETAAPLIASQVALLEKAKPGRLGAWLRAASPGRRIFVAMASLALVLLMLLPIPYSVSSDYCRLQPLERRTVASPIDNRLHKIYVGPGDKVEQGTLLAELDGRELRWKLAEAKARLGSAIKKRNNSMVEGYAATTQMAQLEADAIRLEVEGLQYQVDNLRIVAPIAGVVISGDLEHSVGVPVSTGRKLFEIASLRRMRVEISIPDGEVQHVKLGAETTIRLESRASQKWKSKIDGLFPISEIHNDRNVFVATAELVDDQQQLLPGMRGSARTAAGRKPIGWILFHRLWDYLRLRTW